MPYQEMLNYFALFLCVCNVNDHGNFEVYQRTSAVISPCPSHGEAHTVPAPIASFMACSKSAVLCAYNTWDFQMKKAKKKVCDAWTDHRVRHLMLNDIFLNHLPEKSELK